MATPRRSRSRAAAKADADETAAIAGAQPAPVPTPADPLAIEGQGKLEADDFRTSLNQPAPADNDDAGRAARDAEIGRQRAQVDAVRDANEHQLPQLGGPIMNPGNPELDER